MKLYIFECNKELPPGEWTSLAGKLMCAVGCLEGSAGTWYTVAREELAPEEMDAALGYGLRLKKEIDLGEVVKQCCVSSSS